MAKGDVLNEETQLLSIKEHMMLLSDTTTHVDFEEAIPPRTERNAFFVTRHVAFL